MNVSLPAPLKAFVDKQFFSSSRINSRMYSLAVL